MVVATLCVSRLLRHGTLQPPSSRFLRRFRLQLLEVLQLFLRRLLPPFRLKNSEEQIVRFRVLRVCGGGATESRNSVSVPLQGRQRFSQLKPRITGTRVELYGPLQYGESVIKPVQAVTIAAKIYVRDLISFSSQDDGFAIGFDGALFIAHFLECQTEEQESGHVGGVQLRCFFELRSSLEEQALGVVEGSEMEADKVVVRRQPLRCFQRGRGNV